MASKLTSLLSILSCLAPVFAIQAANFNISASVAESYGCGPKCQEILKLTTAADLSTMGTDFDFAFYETAANFSASKPGDLLKLQAVDPNTLEVDSGLTVYRFQYTSQDLDGSPIPVTGFVAFPFVPPSWSKNAFPLLAFAHGTIGMYRGCAPSSSPTLFDYKSWSLLTQRGYAVVATDYAGLGNNQTAHKYCSFTAHANDVFYSVIAAKKAFGKMLTSDWVSAGHSQGGSTVWKLAEQVQQLIESNNSTVSGRYLGTVSLSPAPRVRDIIYSAAKTGLSAKDFHRYITTAEIPSIAVALRSAFPTFNASTFIAEPLQRRLALADRAQLCTTGMMGLTADLSLEDLISPIFINDALTNASNNVISKWQEMNIIAGGGRATEPVLVVQGMADTSVVPAVTIETYEEACRTPGYEVHLSLYPGQDHSPTVVATSSEWLDWVEDRFRGVKTSGACSSTTRVPFDPKHVKEDREVDFSKAL
jgi:pimeloyl-ACP methyl ester carboxylesterase